MCFSRNGEVVHEEELAKLAYQTRRTSTVLAFGVVGLGDILLPDYVSL